jgi:LacI family transcriptional regulator
MSAQFGEATASEPRRDLSARYKYQRLRDRLRQAVKSGELSGKLPGERELARRYDANAKTVNKALCDLTSEGLLVRHVGRGTFVADGAAPMASSRRKLLTYAWISGVPTSADETAVQRRAESLVRERGHRLVCVRLAEPGDGVISDSAVTPGQLRSWDGIVLQGRTSDRLLADLHRRHLPCVLVQNTHERIRTSAVLTDYAQGAFELTQYLVRLGHEQIRLVISADLAPAACAAEAGYRAALQRNGLRAAACTWAEPGFRWDGLLSAVDRPTALICVGSALARDAVLKAAAGNVAIPSRLSLCALCEPGEPLVDPAITSYEVRAEDIAHWVVELLLGATPGQLPRMIIVPGQLTDRGSVATPSTGVAHTPHRPAHVEV